MEAATITESEKVMQAIEFEATASHHTIRVEINERRPDYLTMKVDSITIPPKKI